MQTKRIHERKIKKEKAIAHANTTTSWNVQIDSITKTSKAHMKDKGFVGFKLFPVSVCISFSLPLCTEYSRSSLQIILALCMFQAFHANDMVQFGVFKWNAYNVSQVCVCVWFCLCSVGIEHRYWVCQVSSRWNLSFLFLLCLLVFSILCVAIALLNYFLLLPLPMLWKRFRLD